MNLKELNSFKLSDAVTFHDKLNPKLWNGTKLRPDVREQLIVIAQDFLQELGVNDLDVKDITISGSNAAFSYTKHSDLDLHILVDMGNLPTNEVYKELFNAKKTIYNDTHDIKINNIPVELYVQDSRQPVVSLGEYSVMNDEWIKIPTKRRSDFDQTATKSKYEKLLSLIEIALKSKKYSKVKHIIDTIKRYRQAGLDKGGEFGPENLAYKMLRSQGYITKLYELRDKLHSEKLSFETMYQNIHEEVDQEIHNYSKLDNILEKLCDMVVKGQQSDKDYGMVAACVLDPDNNIVAGLNSPGTNGKRVHAERVAIEKYENKYGTVPEGSIVITTLSPCNESDDETAMGRVGESCTDYLNSKGIEKVYCGYMDPTQDNFNREFNIMETSDKAIRHKCKQFADTFLKKEINEAFDQPYPLKWETSDYGDVDALARLPDGSPLSIMFNQQQDNDGEAITQVEFYRNNSQEVTGEGDAQRIFATVLTAIQKYIKKYKPLRLTFSASKEIDMDADYVDAKFNPESRAKLYDRLVQRYAKAWGYRAFRADNGDLVIYEFSRIQKQKAVGEDYTMQFAIEKTPPVSPYAGIKDNQYRGGISEAVSDNYLYHSIQSMDTFRKIINTGEIKPKTPIEYEENDIEMPVISASRNQYYRFPYGGGNIQFVIDKDALKHSGFKVKPYSYAQHYGTKKDAPAGNELHKQETEEQIFPLKGYGIPVKQPYIVGIQINPKFKDTPELEEIQKLSKSVNIPVSFMKTATKPVAKKVDIKLTPKFDPNRFVISPATGGVKAYYPMMLVDKETGSKWGLEADYTNADINDRLKNVNEASGYIPSEKEKNDPRFKTALTVDINPYTMKKGAKQFGWNISRAGIPPTAKTNGKI